MELISKNTTLYDLRCCDNTYFSLYCVPCSVRLSRILHCTQYTHNGLK